MSGPDHHPCAEYLKTVHVPDLKVKTGSCRPGPPPKPLPCNLISGLPVKTCCLPPIPPPPPPDACKEQRIRNLLKAGYKLCPKKPPPPPPPPLPTCLAICRERIKNYHPASDSKPPCGRPRYPHHPCN